MPVYSVTVFNVTPECVTEFTKRITNANRLFERYGDKSMGWWTVEAGAPGGPQVIQISQWDSMDHRCEALDKMKNDPEYMKLMTEQGKMIRSTDNYVCVASPVIPMKPVHSNKKMVMINYKVNHTFISSAEKMAEIVKLTTEKLPYATPVALFHPLVFSHHRLLMLWELPNNKCDQFMMGWKDLRMDPMNRMKFEESITYFHPSCMRILAPVEQH